MYNAYGSHNEFVERVTRRVFIPRMRSLRQNPPPPPFSTEHCICGSKNCPKNIKKLSTSQLYV